MRGLGALLILLVIIPKSIQFCTTLCPVYFKTLGCYRDEKIPNRRLPHYILTDRDTLISIWSGQLINWFHWEAYTRDFACRCAQKARTMGYDLFGLQFYGECWAGHSSQNAPRKQDALTSGCLGDYYKNCGVFDRFCVGRQWQNMIYQIVDPSCDVKFQRVGCYNDYHKNNSRPLPEYVLNDRDTSLTSIFSGKFIDWRNWDVYVPDLACRCAKVAREKKRTYFGLQFYGECWTQSEGDEVGLYARDGPTDTCTNNCYHTCKPTDKFCVGDGFTNAVYKIDGPCDIQIEEKGCFKESPSRRLLPTEIRNEIDPTSKAFGSELLNPITWVNDFALFLCKCARTVREKGYRYFGVNNIGSCRSGAISNNYAALGAGDQCFMGKEGQSCVPGDKLCAGWDQRTNFVYEIKNPKQSW